MFLYVAYVIEGCYVVYDHMFLCVIYVLVLYVHMCYMCICVIREYAF